MKQLILILMLINSTIISAQLSPPNTHKSPVIDTYFGIKVTDNYRWLEDINNKEVQDWFKAQGEYTDAKMNKIPGRDLLINEWLELDKLKSISRREISMYNDRYFYTIQKPEENVGKLYYRDGKNGEEKLLFDPATFPGTEGKTYSISYFVPCNDASKVAIGVSEGGAEVSTIKIINVNTHQWYKESIYPSWFGVSGWTEDNSAFLYTAQKSGDPSSMDLLIDTKVKLHVAGTDPEIDKEIFSREKYPALDIKPEDLCFVDYSDDYKYIFAYLAGVQSEINCFYAPASELTNNSIEWKRLLSVDDEVTSFYVNNDRIYLLSHKGAPKFQLLAAPINNFDIKNAEVVYSEGKDKIEYIKRSKDYLFLVLTDGITNSIVKYDLKTDQPENILLPSKGQSNISTFNPRSNEALIFITSWNLPNTTYDYDASTGKLDKSVFWVPVEYAGLDEIAVEEVEARSYDGTMVPLSIIYRKDLKLDGSNSCIIDGYGSYGSSTLPYFSILDFAMVKKGVVMAFAHVRGGGEKGENWYKAGYRTTKPNTWKDFIACGEYLIEKGFTSPEKLAGTGTSAGGILIGRAITERPDLFAAAISNVSLSNVLRFELTPNGPNNTKEFGISTDSVDCMALMEMDAFLHVKDGTKYPAVMCVTGVNDPRVISWQPGKFAAALQNATTSGKPVFLRVDYDNGHFTSDKSVAFKNYADQFSFLLWQTGHPDFQLSQ